ncbi:MAG: hypothetical protein JRH07_03795 [Deltaproteobacteria bacterium]|nr:hypothetical protein [Deltaproteobacteria bacterium]
MFRSKRTRQDRTPSKLQHLCYLVVQLDSIRAFKRIALTEIERSFQEIHQSKLWEEIRPDVEKIVYFPSTIPRALKLMQVSALLRRLFPICLFSVILFVLDQAGIVSLPTSPAASFVFIILPIAILIAFVYADLLTRRTIIQYERRHPNMQTKQKEHIKTAIERLIQELNREIQAVGRKPGNYKMEVFFTDYRGINIVRENRARLSRRKYPVYLAIPAPTGAAE